MINTLKNFKHKKLFILFIFCWALLTIGTTYAYFAYMEEDTVAIQGNIIAVNAELEVDLVVGTNTEMVPLLDAALSNALNGVGSTNGACIDRVGNLSCQVYKITLINKGSRLEHLTGTIELYPKEGTGNAYSNLKWRELTNPTTIKEDSIINGMEKSPLVTNLTIESKQEIVWYIAVWISEIEDDQKEIDKGDFGGTVTFDFDDSYAEITDELAPNAPVITRVDYNTFQYNATDNVSTTGYYITKDNNTAPTKDDNWSTTTSYDINGAGTYRVWARDNVGNISQASSINAYTITRSAGTGSSLMTRYDSTSEGTGTSFTSDTVVLEGTPVYAKASNNSGYANPILTSTGVTATNGSSITISNDVTLTSSAVVGNYSIKDSSGTITDYAVTLADAVSKAYSGNTISLLRNYSDESIATVNKNLILDIPSGKTLTRTNTSSSITVNSGVTLTKTGTGTLTSSVKTLFSTSGNLIIKEGTISCTGTNGGCNVAAGLSGSVITVDGGTLTTAADGSNAVLSSCYNGGTTSTGIVINDGTISGYVAANAYSNCYLRITGGSFSATGSYALQTSAGNTDINTGTITISGGTIDNSSTAAGAIYHRSSGKISITGGTITCSTADSCITNVNDGGIDIKGATVISADTVIYNAGTGTIKIGDTGQTGAVSTSIKGTGTNKSTIYCGKTTGSQAECYIYSGATITSTAGTAIINYNADYRQYAGTKISCSSTTRPCIYNYGTTLTNSYYGRIYIRQGYVQSVYYAIYSAVKSNRGVYIGNASDDLYNWSIYTGPDESNVDIYKGPMIRASDSTNGIGIYTKDYSDTFYGWEFHNGLVGGAKDYSNVAPSTSEESARVDPIVYTPHNGSTYKYLSLDAA